MDDQVKAAYRHLLYVAMVSIRNNGDHRAPASRNPLTWYRQYQRSRISGETADWLHNLAHFNAVDFVGFEESRFWEEHRGLALRFPTCRWSRYREIFEACLKGEIYFC